MKKSQSIFILLGGNQGDVKRTFAEVCMQIENLCNIVQTSPLYITEPWGMETKDLFYNQALEIETSLKPLALLEKFQEIEKTYGRVPKVGNAYESRVIDIDILLWGTEILDEPNLTVPHPRMHIRNFTLIPLKEIAPNTIHPVLGKTIQELATINGDNLSVSKA